MSAAATITNDSHHVWTHHTDRGVCVECVACGVLEEIPPQPKDQPSAREIAKATKAQHEEENR